MPEETPRRRRSQGVRPEAPLHIKVEDVDNEPEWMASAGTLSGAAERRKPKREEPRISREHTSPENPAGSRPVRTVKQPVSAKRPAPRRKVSPAQKKRQLLAARNRIAAAAIVIVLIIAAVFVIGKIMNVIDIKHTLDRGDGKFYGNISINGLSLEGMSLDQADAALRQQLDSLLGSLHITLRTQDGRSWDITKDELKMQYSVADQLDSLWSIGHTGSASERYAQIKNLEENPVSVYTSMTYDMSAVNQILMEIKEEVDVSPVNAARVDNAENWPPFSYTDDRPGQELDVSGLNEKICGMVDRLESGTVDLTPTPVQAEITRKDLEAQIVLLSTFETRIATTSEAGRFINIELGTNRFNHLVVSKDETVSFNSVTGKRTLANGYAEAPEIAYGEYVTGVGGGICQVSSTLYNAVVGAGMKVVKRYQHSHASSYVEKGQDATVSDDRLDFVFKNTTGADAYIETSYYKKKGYYYTQFKIYGRPDPNGYTYKLESDIKEVIEIPEMVYRQDKDAQYVVYDDQSYQTQEGEEGYIVDVYIVTSDRSGNEVSRELDHTDTYNPIAPVTYVGVTPRETPAP